MINKVTLIGRLGNDPEIKTLENGTSVCRMSLATSDAYKDKEGNWVDQTEWHSVTLWRELAERAEKYARKGMQVYVEGKITYRKYTDKDGIERNMTEIVAATFRLLEKRESSDNSASEPQQPQRQQQKPAQATQMPDAAQANFNDLPF